MRHRLGNMVPYLFLLLFTMHWGCDETTTPGGDDPAPVPDPGGPAPGGPVSVELNPVGSAIDDLLIDLEFLPGQNGEAIAITQDGNVYYLRNDFAPLATAASIPVTYAGDERGLLNIVADPLYGGSNHFVYFYYTLPSPANANRVEQYEVNVNVGAGTFSLNNPQTIIEFPTTAANHNGGSMVFMTQEELAIGVGDGAVSANAQTLSNRLGKVHRIIPNRPGPGFAVPPDNPFVSVLGAEASIYAVGVRNPFTLVVDGAGDLFVGDVGGGLFEEINFVDAGGENLGWPLCEGPCDPPNPALVDPIHGFSHSDTTFYDEDPLPNDQGSKAIIVSAIYQGSEYDGLLTDKLIYNEFFGGWVRLLTLGPAGEAVGDEHLSHLEGLTGLQTNPADDFLYGVSLGGSDQILRLDLTP